MLSQNSRWLRAGFCALLLPLFIISLVTRANAQANFGDLFGGLIQMGMAQESWKALGSGMRACLDRELQPQGESVQSLASRGVMANHPQIQPLVARCQQIERVGTAWRGVDAHTESCVSELLHPNNQSVQTLVEMGVGPSDPQISPLLSQCQQIDSARKAWVSLDPYVKTCVDSMLKSGGQSIELLAAQRIFPADPQASPVMSRCRPISSQNLMKDIACTIDGTSSRCDEFYVLEQAPSTPLTVEQLVDAMITSQSVGKNQLEIASAKAARLARLAERRKAMIADGALKKLAGLIDPANKFAYAKAIEMRNQIEAARANPRLSEQDLVKLDGAAGALVVANNEEIERQRLRKAEILSRGEVEVSGEGTGANQQAARIDAYYQVFENQLRDSIGGQADGDIGQQFRKQASGKFDKFRSDFFVGSTKENCRKNKGTFACSIEGVFKLGTLKSEVHRIMSGTLAGPQRNYRFILAYQETEDDATRYLIDSIRAEFVNSGYKVIARSAEEEARARGDFDFYLNILDISYDGGLSDVGSIGGAGVNVFDNYVLKARVKLLDNNKDPAARQELAIVPVINTKRIPRDAQMPREARRNQLLPGQANELARQVYRDISERLLTITAAQDGADAGGPVKLSGQYSIKIMGLTQRDREKIRALRNAVTKVLAGTETSVDPEGTNDKSVEIHFEHPEKFDPEDVVDALYEAFKDKKTFKVRYEGHNSFAGSL